MEENRHRTNVKSICWDCEHSVPNMDGTRGCSWSRNFIPVEGWEAERYDLRFKPGHYIESYIVRKCPEYKGDPIPEKETLPRYIDANRILGILPEINQDEQVSLKEAVDDFRMIVNQIETADVAPVVHAKWIDKPTGRHGAIQSYCSNCNRKNGYSGFDAVRHRPFCPNCGAKMDLEG